MGLSLPGNEFKSRMDCMERLKIQGVLLILALIVDISGALKYPSTAWVFGIFFIINAWGFADAIVDYEDETLG